VSGVDFAGPRCWILHAHFTTVVISSGFGSFPNSSKAPPVLTRSVLSNTARSRSFRELSDVAQGLRCIKIMEATQRHPNLLSEKQAAKRLGVARITLLRAREAGRIRFFRIGTRVLYSNEQLADFLAKCERNGQRLDPKKVVHEPSLHL
jgi:excisionase family DNA binding protein